jgi:hypothetical protein
MCGSSHQTPRVVHVLKEAELRWQRGPIPQAHGDRTQSGPCASDVDASDGAKAHNDGGGGRADSDEAFDGGEQRRSRH